MTIIVGLVRGTLHGRPRVHILNRLSMVVGASICKVGRGKLHVRGSVAAPRVAPHRELSR